MHTRFARETPHTPDRRVRKKTLEQTRQAVILQVNRTAELRARETGRDPIEHGAIPPPEPDRDDGEVPEPPAVDDVPAGRRTGQRRWLTHCDDLSVEYRTDPGHIRHLVRLAFERGRSFHQKLTNQFRTSSDDSGLMGFADGFDGLAAPALTGIGLHGE